MKLLRSLNPPLRPALWACDECRALSKELVQIGETPETDESATANICFKCICDAFAEFTGRDPE